MYRVSMYDSNSISTLFSSMSSQKSKSTGFTGAGIDLSTYSMIRSGSYGKLMKSYVKTDSFKNSITSTSTSKDDAKTLTGVKSAAEELKSSAAELYKSTSKLFKENSEGEIDKDALYKAVDDFVSDYNSTLKAAGKSNTSSIASTASGMINATQMNASLLSKVGITVDSDYSLKLDKKSFMDSKMSDVKALFNGNGSFAYSTAVKASKISSSAQYEAAKSNTYSKGGSYTYNYTTGELYNDTL